MTLSDKELVPLEVRKVSKKGGSLSITIPTEIAKLLNLKPDDSLIFLYDMNRKRIIINKVVPTYTTPSGLSFSISKELFKKLLKEKKNEK